MPIIFENVARIADSWAAFSGSFFKASPEPNDDLQFVNAIFHPSHCRAALDTVVNGSVRGIPGSLAGLLPSRKASSSSQATCVAANGSFPKPLAFA